MDELSDDDFKNGMLDCHNGLRSTSGNTDLTWSTQLQRKATIYLQTGCIDTEDTWNKIFTESRIVNNKQNVQILCDMWEWPTHNTTAHYNIQRATSVGCAYTLDQQCGHEHNALVVCGYLLPDADIESVHSSDCLVGDEEEYYCMMMSKQHALIEYTLSQTSCVSGKPMYYAPTTHGHEEVSYLHWVDGYWTASSDDDSVGYVWCTQDDLVDCVEGTWWNMEDMIVLDDDVFVERGQCHNASSTKDNAGVAVVIVLLLMLMAAFGGFVWWKRNKMRSVTKEMIKDLEEDEENMDHGNDKSDAKKKTTETEEEQEDEMNFMEMIKAMQRRKQLKRRKSKRMK
eukprot:630119_1